MRKYGYLAAMLHPWYGNVSRITTVTIKRHEGLETVVLTLDVSSMLRIEADEYEIPTLIAVITLV